MNNDLFFSVCTEVTNRSSTIIDTIKSIEKQIFKNYEYIIYENCSDDNSLEIIKSHIQQSPIREKIKLIPGQIRKKDIESWNMPLKYAEATYIAVCEGDDMFDENHLENLHYILSNNLKIGILVSLRTDDSGLSNYSHLGYDRTLSSRKMKQSLIGFDFCPAPSETCFLRVNPITKESFFYDEENLVYAGEYSIYESIISSGLDCYISSKRSIERGLSEYRKGYFHIKDAYFYRQTWMKLYKNDQFLKVSEKLFKKSFSILLSQIPSLKLEGKLLNHLKEELSNVRKLKMIIHCLEQLLMFFYYFARRNAALTYRGFIKIIYNRNTNRGL